MNTHEYIAVLITAPNEDEGAGIAQKLVESKLAACVNIVKGIRSIYRWKGALEDDPEVLLIAKTERKLLERLTAAVKEMHSYDVPETIALPILGGSQDYLSWVTESTED